MLSLSVPSVSVPGEFIPGRVQPGWPGVLFDPGRPVLITLVPGQSGAGRGMAAFTVYDSTTAETYSSILDDGSGNMILGGALATALTRPSSAYAMTGTDSVVLADGAGTVTLPDASLMPGRACTVKQVASGPVTVAAVNSQAIDGAVSYSLSAQYKFVTVVSDGANWFITASN